MELITIEVKEREIIVHDGVLKGAKEKWYAPGLSIYLKGKVSIPRRAAVQHCAMEQALARHIPLISLFSLGWVK